ncbi:hypothetical protein T12_8178 [Trichinella patagoniensis]|uniref:Uncharacterized protein n=1 Tax=Trichinella patagoniensis TaxID=990121 RepID=A0A0V0ZP64_9BILA|nr:hypothetical protein T12_8178 [Trichinella patagoniensis]
MNVPSMPHVLGLPQQSNVVTVGQKHHNVPRCTLPQQQVFTGSRCPECVKTSRSQQCSGSFCAYGPSQYAPNLVFSGTCIHTWSPGSYTGPWAFRSFQNYSIPVARGVPFPGPLRRAAPSPVAGPA